MGAKLKDDDALWDIYRRVQAAKVERRLSKPKSRDLAKELIAQRWQVSVEDISAKGENVLYTNLAKIMILAFPKTARAQENLTRDLHRATFNEALELARGNYESLEQVRSGKTQRAARPVITLGIPVSDLLDFLIGQAAEQGYSQEELLQLFSERIRAFFSDDHE
jgi:hypothetical protein